MRGFQLSFVHAGKKRPALDARRQEKFKLKTRAIELSQLDRRISQSVTEIRANGAACQTDFSWRQCRLIAK
jgi:hypothetical protein